MLDAMSERTGDGRSSLDDIERSLRLLREAPIRIAAATDGADRGQAP